MFKSGRLDVEAFTRANGFVLLDSICPYCCTSFDCIIWKPGDELRDTLVDLSPLSDCFVGVVSFTRLPFLEDSFPDVLLDARLVLRSGVALETLRVTSPSDICGLPWEIFPALLVFGGRPEVEGDPSTAFNNE